MEVKIAVLKDTRCAKPWWPFYVERCKERTGITHAVLDSQRSDWFKRLLEFAPNGVIWRAGHLRPEHTLALFQRLLLHFQTKLLIYPTVHQHWHYDNKLMQTRMFQLHGIPHPPTYITYSEAKAREFVRARKKWPMVNKTSGGAGSSGVSLIKNREEGLRLCDKAFHGTGIKSASSQEVGFIYLQEYIPAPQGIIRVSVYGLHEKQYVTGFYEKNRPNDFRASNSNIYTYESLPEDAMRLCVQVCEKMNLLWSMIDVIRYNGRWLVLEVSDTCGLVGTNSRKFTYSVYGKGENAMFRERENNTDFRNIIFEVILHDIKRSLRPDLHVHNR